MALELSLGAAKQEPIGSRVYRANRYDLPHPSFSVLQILLRTFQVSYMDCVLARSFTQSRKKSSLEMYLSNRSVLLL